MKSVALVGFAPNTIGHVKSTQAGEIWSIVWGYKYEVLPRIDRLFEMHPIWQAAASTKREYVKPREHWEWLKRNRNIPVYMLEKRPEVPQAIEYPIDEVSELLSGWTRSGEQMRMFTSSFDYMFALAILEGFDEIEIIGAEMSSDSEYKYQREGYGFWHAFALGRGIKVRQYAPTELLYRPKRYGYDGAQMVYRQDLERLRGRYSEQHRDALARVQYFEGQVSTAGEAFEMYTGEDEDTRNRLNEHYAAKHERLGKERDMLAIASGALQAVDYLLREIDLEEPSAVLASPFDTVITDE